MHSKSPPDTAKQLGEPGYIYALWARQIEETPCTRVMDSVLRMIMGRFDVDSVIIALLGKGGSVVKIRCGKNPLEMGYTNALAECASHHAGVMVAQDIVVDAEQPTLQALRFYVGAPLVIGPLGDPVGALSLIGTEPKAFSEHDRLLFKSAALAISAMLVMPHDPAVAAAIALTAEKGVVLINHDQALEAVNRQFTQITHFSFPDVQRIGVEQLLCLDRPHAGAVVLGHALMVEIAGQGMTRCQTKSGSTLPVEVLAFPLPDKSNRIGKTVLLISPLFNGSTDDFLLSLRPTERDELLEMHIAGLWALDSAGKILKLTGAPIAHLEQSAHTHMLGKRLGSEGVFDTAQTDWSGFYGQLAADKLPPEVECCVTYEGDTQWFSMKGFRQADARGTTVGYHGSFRDITDRKMRELSLRKSEERLSLILKGTNDGAWDWDMETGLSYLSPRWWSMMGRTPEPGPFSGDNWTVYMHPDDRDRVRAVLREAIANGRENYQAEFRMQHQRGHYITVLGRGHVLYNSEGKAIRTAGTNVDLTQQRQSQAQIRLLQSCVESIEDVVLITHASPINAPGPIIMYVNPAFELFTGYSREEVIGKSPRLLQGPLTSREELDKISEALQQWKSVKVELANYKKNGELFWIELEITPVRADGSDRFTHWIGVQRHITRRKITQLALQTSNERLNLAMETAGLGFWTSNLVRGESFYDERWYTMLGYSPKSTPFHPDGWLKLVHPDDLAFVSASKSEAVLRLDQSFEKEFRMRHRDGRWVWIYSRGKVIERDASGKPVRIVGTHMDVTAAVEARQVAERLNLQLSRCLEHLSVGVMLQCHGVIKFVNSTLLSIFGGTRSEDLVGTRFSNLVLPEDVATADWRRSQLIAGVKLPSIWFGFISLDGSSFRALVSSTLIEWEGEPHILSCITPPGDTGRVLLEAEAKRH